VPLSEGGYGSPSNTMSPGLVPGDTVLEEQKVGQLMTLYYTYFRAKISKSVEIGLKMAVFRRNGCKC